MKKLLLTCAALAAAPLALVAQILNVTAPGFSGAKLFDSTAGFTITGMGADAAGAIYYLETDGAFSANTRLYKRVAADSYATATPLHDLGSVAFGSFVTVSGGKVYFGESSTNSIYAINPDGTGLDLLGTVTSNYDGAFVGGSLLLSHNPAAFPSAANKVSKFDLVTDGGGGLMLSLADTVIDTVSDFSGPIEVNAAGSLFYGATAFNGISDLFRFTDAEVAGAFGPTSLALDTAHRVLPNGLNGYLAAGPGTGLWQTSFSALNFIDTAAATSLAIGSSAHSIGHLDFQSGALFAGVTNFSTNRSAVYAVTPEPSTALLLTFGVLALARRRK